MIMTDIDHLLKLIADPRTLDIYNDWPSFPLDDVDNQSGSLNKPGIYAIVCQNSQILYIGKGRSVYSRLKSHYNATQKKERAEAWAQFFDHFNSNLKAYYLLIDKISDANVEKVNQAIERVLQVKHNPLFDRMYNSKGKRRIHDFHGRLRECDYAFPPPNSTGFE